MKYDPSLVIPVRLTWELSGRLGEIIKERIAGVPLEQRTDIARRTIIEVLQTRQEVPLEGLVRRHVSLELERLWLSQWELNEIDRQRKFNYIESVYSLAKLGRENKAWAKAGKPKPKSTALEAAANEPGVDPEALKLLIKRERRAKKKSQQTSPRSTRARSKRTAVLVAVRVAATGAVSPAGGTKSTRF